MVMSPEELTILHSIAQTVTNTTSYGYEIAIKGTVIDGIANIVCGLILIAVGLYSAKKIVIWAKREEDNSDGISYVLAFLGIVVIFAITSLILTTWIHDPLMQIFAPEYVVVKEILKAAASVAT
jgi:hypothetical protein